MTDYSTMMKRFFTYIYIGLTASAFLAGCGREEKTLLLPEIQSSAEETEGTDPAKGFSVKKIYAYSYETWLLPKKTAFLQECGENGIHIVALDEQDDDPSLVYRHVDYRYGFYDTLGEFFHFQENWFNPAGNFADEDLYIDALLPSPDGTQLLIYIRSVYDDTCLVWLYTAGFGKPWLLYDGELTQGCTPKGSFSPDGRWVTYDLAGDTTGPDSIVPIYDCLKDTFLDREQYWTVLPAEGEPRYFYPPDTFLYAAIEADGGLWTGSLCSLPGNDTPGLLSVLQGDLDDNFFQMEYRDSSLPAPEAAGPGQSGSRLFYVGNDQEENREAEYIDSFQLIPALDRSGDSRIRSSYSYLNMEKEMPYFLYRFCEKDTLLYYMGDACTLNCINTDTLQEHGQPRNFPEPVWDFLPLESGDLLAVLAQAYSVSPKEDLPPVNSIQSPHWKADYACPDFVQSTWDIQSGDLYLYPADGSPRQLLYKNVQNLLSMEYDAQTRRILLETFEENYPSHRTCIILEL